LKLHGNTREHAKCHFGIGKDQNGGRSKRKKKMQGKRGRERGSKTLIYLKGERKVSLFLFFEVVDFYMF
jgi:hypothetical protein